ncbi:putative crocetin glucosyltransferase [Helianthus annuus]|nr:putative crocetin glucosyltransferase [Helianthus annuus]KAJ0649499.1 putative crocetin glucosyltransferase [Helianthus annuus]KAJ0653296.1 putative crocetin glucosyltransferase [Helianthus annuus]KAJ0845727.1 putative crocetin glucosyltransferase [Helianthus annuus]
MPIHLISILLRCKLQLGPLHPQFSFLFIHKSSQGCHVIMQTSTRMTGHRKILIVAYSGKGHINPALRFANRLLKLGVNVTFCTSLSVVQRIDNETIPQGLTFAPFSDGHDRGKQPNTPLQQFISDFETNGARAAAEVIVSAADTGQPFDCLVYTTVIPWVARVAHAHGVKSTLLWCQPATVLDIYYYYFNGYQSLISSNNNNPTFPINLPGLPPLTITDLPSFLLASCPKEHEFLLQIMKDHIDVLKLTTSIPRILVNTVDELETKSIRAIEKLEFLPIGPLIRSDGKDSAEHSLGMDFFEKTDDHYIEWLNTQAKSSVVYVSFGTIATFQMEQLEEMAVGLMEIHRPFLWVIRDSEQAERLRKMAGLQNQGMIVGWCSQVEVLSHEAIGCVVMHCGWNSTVEVLVAGVRIVAFPQWSDQGTNAKMVEDVWKTGVRVRTREGDGMVEGTEIARCVEMVMEDEQMKTNAEKWKEVTREALNNGGSSTVNLQSFLHDL